jgi:hypothetical protein
MLLIYPADKNTAARIRATEFETQRDWRATFIWINQVPTHNRQSSVVPASDEHIVRRIWNSCLSQAVQQGKTALAGLLDAAHRHEAEATIERLALGTVFFEHITERPERHHVDQTIALANVLGESRAHIDGIPGL